MLYKIRERMNENNKRIELILTRHVVERLLERKAQNYRKISGEIIANTVQNVIRFGKYLEKEGKNLRFSTNKYTICCVKQSNTLIVTTVMDTREMMEEYKKALHFLKESPYKNSIIFSPLKQIFEMLSILPQAL